MEKYFVLKINCEESITDILIAELSGLDFDSFEETDHGIDAYISEDLYNSDAVEELLKRYHLNGPEIEEMAKDTNWNELWEKNFDPVNIDNKIYIRAPFHASLSGIDHEIVIEPKMSFGTGHHETTFLMSRQILTLDLKEKDVLDVGTGTGILSVLAHQLGTKSLILTDIDDWCIGNAHENMDLNQVKDFRILKGTIQNLSLSTRFDVILANINKNILLEEVPYYSGLLKPKGYLLLSGFYSEDEEAIQNIARLNNLNPEHTDRKNNWSCMLFSKK